MIEHIKKWALEKLLRDIVKKLKVPNQYILAFWHEHKEEIVTKIVKVVEKTIIECIMKAVKEKSGTDNGQINN